MNRSLSGGNFSNHSSQHGGGFRGRLRSNASDASSTDLSLDGSFNSGMSPFGMGANGSGTSYSSSGIGVSTTVFNYNTLKEQLNSPAKRTMEHTSKWCQDSAAVTMETHQEQGVAEVIGAKLRSSSASNINKVCDLKFLLISQLLHLKHFGNFFFSKLIIHKNL